VEGDPVSHDLDLLLQGSGGANNQNSPAAVLPEGPAQPLFTYQNSGAVGAVRIPGSLVFFAFGFEAISGAGTTAGRTEVLERVLSDFNPDLVTAGNPFSLPTFTLYHNYPNPFNSVTGISFQLLREQFVTLEVYNLLGARVEVLVQERLPAGLHRVSFDGGPHPSGIYFCTLTAAGHTQTIKMISIK
jgi:hypothetical protein